MERPDESGQLERGTSGVCHSRRVGRGHRGRESGAVVSERTKRETTTTAGDDGPANSEEEEEEEEENSIVRVL